MADFGNGPYAWIKDSADETSYVGLMVADSESGFPDDIEVSTSLQNDFAEWAMNYDTHGLDSFFDFGTHNHRGEELSIRLKRELGERFRIMFRKEQPTFDDASILEIKMPE